MNKAATPDPPSPAATGGAPETMDRIVDAATRLFADRGYAESTISELSKAAGVSRALLFFYFGSKEGLLDRVVAQARQEVGAVFERASDVTGLAAIEAFLEARAGFFRDRPHIARLMIVLRVDANAHSRSAAAFLEYQNRRIKLFRRCLAEAVEDGSLRPDAPVPELALLFASATDGDLRMWAVDPERRPIDGTHAAILAVLDLLRADSTTPAH